MISQMVAGQVVISAIFYVGIAAVIVTSLFWNWWSDVLGWSVISSVLALCIAVLPAMVRLWFGPAVFETVAWLNWVAIAALALDPIITAWRVWVLWKIHQRVRAAALADDPPQEPMHA